MISVLKYARSCRNLFRNVPGVPNMILLRFGLPESCFAISGDSKNDSASRFAEIMFPVFQNTISYHFGLR